ncbi:MAG: Ig-like domain-containing protein [Burkholderiaceae bacterium]
MKTSRCWSTRAPTALVGFDSATDDAPRITGPLTSGAVTNDTSPTLTGALPAALASGDKIMVLRDGVEVGQAQIQGNQFVFTDGGLADGRYAYAARLIDAAGNAGNEGSFFELQIDATPPAAPTIAVVAGNDVVVAGEAPGGVTVSGSAAPGVAVELDWNGQTRTVTSDAGGQWSALFGSFPQGVHDIRASVVDVAGNVATTTRRVTVDTVAPDAPQIFAPEGGDNVVNSAEAAGGIGISGRAEAGARIELNWGGRSATATANAQGNWSTSFSSPPGQGQSTITAVAVDGVGNRSAPGSRTVTVDTVAPAPPGINAVSVDDRITVADLAGGITISGNAEGGAQVLVSWAGVTRQTTASGGGSWSVNYADAPLQGPSTITARATDGAGNTGATASRNVTANTIPPPPPPGVDTVAGDNIVNDAEKRAGVTITGAAQAGATVEVLWGGETQTTTANGAGRWQVGFARGDVPSDGDTTVRVTATNSGGTSAATSLGVEVDTDAPARPGVTAAGNNVVSAAEGVNPILVTGATEAGATVTVTWGGVQLTDVADGSGQWEVTYNTLPVGEGTSRIDAFATDVAGNQGALTRQSVTVQDQFPTTAVTITAIQDDQPPFIGNVAPGGVTNDATPTLTLTLNSLLQADESVVIRRNGAVVDTSSPGGNSFTFENEALIDGAYTFTAQVTNAGGLTGPLSPEYAISVAIL